MNTLKFIATFAVNVLAAVVTSGAGMFARWTMASAPRTNSAASALAHPEAATGHQVASPLCRASSVCP